MGPAGTRAKTRSSQHPHAPSPGLRAMLREIDPGRIQSDIHTLAGFGTRHTLSSQDDPQRGVGAARDWIFDQLQGYAAASSCWEHTVPVGNVTSYTLKNLSKDNVQVGVRAVDRDGFRSPVAFPVPSS
jgi:hypothetical protein